MRGFGRHRLQFFVVALVIGAVLIGVWKWTNPVPPAPTVLEVWRSELELRDGTLFAKGQPMPFQGRIVENYAAGRRKLAIDIRDGKANGLSRGWYDNGQLEVEETFLGGVSHGPRTRWHANGQRKSRAQIDDGKVVGEFSEWHDNGQLATSMTLLEGKPVGLVEAWHPSGALKSRVQFQDGKQGSRQFFEDATLVAKANPEATAPAAGDTSEPAATPQAAAQSSSDSERP